MINPPARLHRLARGHVQELPDDEEDDEELVEDEEYSDDEDFDDEYSDEDHEAHRAANDLFNFGNSLQVKGKPVALKAS